MMTSCTNIVSLRRGPLAIAWVGVCVLGAAGPASAAHYKFTSLNIAGGTTVASALDDDDRVVGTFTPTGGGRTQGQGVVWLNTVPSLIPNTLSLTALSDNGVAAGMGPASLYKYITYDLKKGKIKIYKDGTDVRMIAPTGINKGGTVVALGEARDGGSPNYNQALYLQGDTGLVLEPPGFTVGASLNGINDAGVVAGWYNTSCFTYQGGTYTTFLPSDPDAAFCGPAFINNTGVIYGSYETHDVGYAYHGFLLESGTYSFVNYPGADGTLVTGLGQNGEVVGYYLVGTTSYAFLLIGGNYYALTVPGASDAQIIGINSLASLLISTSTGPYLAQCPRQETCTQ